jgi:peptidoglycan/LPS O-acetylase OafA/YrhL
MTDRLKGASRINEIDLLRFIAVMMVLFYHYAFRGHAADSLSALPYPALAPFAKYGYLGVELFFMISGFVILMSAQGRTVKQFAISRVIRLYPAFWFCCSLTALVVWLYGSPVFKVTAGQYAANMTMLSEFFNVESIDSAYWSLFVEIRFYMFIAALLFFKQLHRVQLFLGLWLAVSIALEFVPLSRPRYWFSSDTSAFFVAGSICYLIRQSGMTRTRLFVLAVCLILAIYQWTAAITKFERHYQVALSAYVVGAIIAASFAAMLLVATNRLGFLNRVNWFALGALTYPLYLLHQNLGYIVFNHFHDKINAHILFWSVVVMAVLLAYAIYQWIEKPTSRRLKRLLTS